jgi:hypothetical protein
MSTDDEAVKENEPLNRAKELLKHEEEELKRIDGLIEEAETKEKNIHRTEEL